MFIRFELFVPTKVITTNAGEVFGQDLRWESNLGYMLKNPLQLSVEIESTPELEAKIK